MYIVLFAFAYIWILMIATASSLLKGVMVFIVGGLIMALVFYIMDTPGRLRRRRAIEAAEDAAAAQARITQD
ncbi:MAG: hypothetical protein V4446_05905 [Pseudomonadota bacterium]|uniref:hypothetical protein n=1 Tax=Sulfuriferula sp. TaxID=2025307 RepID=UPI00272F0731|nr:hypothetical protein [Sulfuriferula sp.]MDP2026298.1 hypothetical protein [Sulfuriferula sp.]